MISLSTSICLGQGTPPPPPGYTKNEKEWKEELKQTQKEQKKANKNLSPDQKVDNSIYARITKGYDRFKDSSFVSLDVMPVYTPSLYTKVNKQPHFYINASFDLAGGETNPKFFSIGFFTKQLQGYWFGENRDLIFLADGERIPIGTPSWDGNVTSTNFLNITINITNEVMTIGVPTDVFLRIANAKSVEFQLGNLEGQLSGKHLEAFRNLISNVPNK
jgi:hypothetical protein